MGFRHSGFRDLGFRDFGFRDFGFRVEDLGIWRQSSGFRYLELGSRVHASGFVAFFWEFHEGAADQVGCEAKS